MRELRVDLDLRLTPRTLRWAAACLLLPVLTTETASEKVTLSTYYPAPSGVYTHIVTTGNTYLARDGGRVGVGTSDPQEKLDVSGTVKVSQDVLVRGQSVVTEVVCVPPLSCAKAGNTVTIQELAAACGPLGQACTSNAQCCSGTMCSGGVCAAPPPACAGSTCNSNAECCPGAFCLSITGVCTPNAQCRTNGGLCNRDTDCCSGNCYEPGFVCLAAVCGGSGQACCANNVCNSGLACNNGVCTLPL